MLQARELFAGGASLVDPQRGRCSVGVEHLLAGVIGRVHVMCMIRSGNDAPIFTLTICGRVVGMFTVHRLTMLLIERLDSFLAQPGLCMLEKLSQLFDILVPRSRILGLGSRLDPVQSA